MTQTDTPLPFSHPLRPADLATHEPTRFELVLEEASCAAIARDIDVSGLRKVRFKGELKPIGKRDWQLSAHLGATVTQECVVTLAPVTTRIEEDVTRQWLAAARKTVEEEEVEMPEDVTQDPLGEVIDLGEVLIETLALALPLYPRAEGADLAEQNFAEKGITPMTDEDARPFAGLASLRDKLAGESDPTDTDT